MNNIKFTFLRFIAVVLILILAISSVPVFADSFKAEEQRGTDIVADSGDISYDEYRKSIKSPSRANEEISVKGNNYSSYTGTVSAGDNGGVLTGSDSVVDWSFEVKSEGFYNLDVIYFPTVSKGGAIERTVKVDGKIPFDEARYIEFSRVYADGEINTNSKGNQVTPEQLEKPRVMTYSFHDANSFVSENLSIYLTTGVHTISFIAHKEQLEVLELKFSPEKELQSYSEYLKQYSSKNDGNNKEVVIVEAEKAIEKSSFTIYPTSDKSSASTYPQHPVKTRLNIISGEKWSKVGQWLTWEIDVKEDGLYSIAPRFKQDAYDGGFVSRKLYVDGECPFKEASSLRFNYSGTWNVEALGGEEPYYFYLKKGKHQIKLEVVLGDLSGIISKIQGALTSLNADYRRILMITGPAPDIYRDYGYEELIPDVLKDFKTQAEVLQSAIDELNEKSNVKGDFTNSINKLIIILDQIDEDPEIISELFSTYKDNLASLGTWIQGIMAQPLDVDRIYVVPKGVNVPDDGDNWFSNIWFKLKMFFLSFTEDYQSFATEITEEDYKKGNVVSVWMTNGREQSQIMQKLTEQYFTPETGLKINVQLVAATALLPSALAGTGPDVAMNLPSSTPIDFAIRKAAVDLSKMEGFNEVTERFHHTAMTPFSFNGSVYALPETMTFLMMFYRTDIFEELNLKAPTTWDEFYEVIWELQQQKLDVGFPINAKTSVVSNMNLYGIELFLYQNGGTIYNKELNASAMSEDLNVECFEKMAELFTLYKFPVDYDFANRFRSGEMPLGIVEYTMYNQLTIFASEIKGLWAMAPVPGTVKEDGTVNNTSPSASSGIMMLKGAENYDNAWKFIKWVTSDETQTRYANEVESVLGAAAKQATANLSAIESMSWTDAEYNALKSQIASLQGTPEIPGGYYTARAIDFAFADVYAGGKEPSSALLTQVEMINQEIARKRKEFGLNN